MNEQRFAPDANRISVLTASVLLAFALTRLVRPPDLTLAVQLLGVEISLVLNLGTLTTVLAAGLTASGMDWLLRGHPSFGGHRSLEHWLLPTLTAFVVGLTLSWLGSSAEWWAGFAVGGTLLVLSFLAEYVAYDPADMRYPLATAGLTALSYALFLLLATALRFSGLRLLFAIPTVALAAFLVCLRVLHLRSSGRWELTWAGTAALVIAQLAVGLHYWPLTHIQFGLVLFGPLYAVTGLGAALNDGLRLRQAALEPAGVLLLTWGAAVLVR